MASKYSTFVKKYAPDFESGYIILLFSTRSGAKQFCETYNRISINNRVSITSSAFARKVMLHELKNLQRERGYESKIAKSIGTTIRYSVGLPAQSLWEAYFDYVILNRENIETLPKEELRL